MNINVTEAVKFFTLIQFVLR